MDLQKLSSFIKQELGKLNIEAREKIPSVKPLIISTNYYEKVKVFGEHMFFIYYAYYGYGKTHGVALKLYHEALNGELKDTHDVIVLQLRDLMRRKRCNPLELTKEMKGVDPILALLAASLIIGTSRERCGSSVGCNCYSTIVEKNKPLSFNTIEIAKKLKEYGSIYLTNMIKEITSKTGKTLVLVFDEFEELIKKGTFTLTGETIDQFLYNLAVILRRDFYDKGFTRFKVVALIQKAILSEAIIKQLSDSLNKSAERGITVFEEIEPYPPEIYADYVISALKRLDAPLSAKANIKLDMILKISEKESFLRQELERALRPLSIMPPRVAFYIAQDFIANLVEEIIRDRTSLNSINRVGILKDYIKSATEKTLNSMKKLSDITKLYILLSTKGKVMDDKATIRRDETLDKMITFIAKEILGCVEGRIASFKYSTYYGVICMKSLEPHVAVDAVLFKLSHSSKTRVDKASTNLANELAKTIANLVHLYLKIKGTSTRGLPKVKINIYPIIRRKASPPLVFPIMEYAVDKLKDIVKERLVKMLNVPRGRLTIEAVITSPYIMEEEDAIILYYKAVKGERGTPFSDYIERRYENLISAIRESWKQTVRR